MKRAALLCLGAATALAVGSAAADEGGDEQKRTGLPRARALSLGVGIGPGTMAVAGHSAARFVPSLVARIGVDPGNRLQLIAELQPAQVKSPSADESFTATNLMVGVSLGQATRVRLGLGVQYRSWSGSQQVVAHDGGPLVGLDLGHEMRLSDRLSLTGELTFRSSLIELEGGVSSRFVGLDCVLSWRPGAPGASTAGH